MELIIIISVIALIYFYRKSKNKNQKSTEPQKVTLLVSGRSDNGLFSSFKQGEDKGFTRLIIKGRDFGVFLFSDSPDKSHRILWMRSGFKNVENDTGAVFIMNGDKDIFSMTQPHSDGLISNREKSASISNNGVFTISVSPSIHMPESVIKFGDPERGFFHSILIKALTDKLYISDNGIYSIIETMGAADDNFRYKLLIIDIQTGEFVGRVKRRYYYCSDIVISENEKNIKFQYGKKHIVVNFAGDTINEADKLDILMDAVKQGELNDFKTAYYLFDENKNERYAENLIRSLLSIDPLDNNINGIDISKAYRSMGDYFSESNPRLSLMYYEKAIEYNPKAGVKRKIKELQEKTDKQK